MATNPNLSTSDGTGGTGVGRPTLITLEDLLMEEIIHPGWEGSVGTMRSYYIRGATWLRGNVLPVVSDLNERTNEDFTALLANYPGIAAAHFNWQQAYSPRQGMAALSLKKRSPIMFNKAVQTILLCQKIADERIAAGSSTAGANDVMSRLRIDPAIFYIRDFDQEQLDRLAGANPHVLERLREMTGQRTRVVFGDMARGQTVTKRLAEATRLALGELFPNEDFGGIDFRYQPGFTLAASTSEALVD
jgi:hypothetical protein